MKFTEALKLSQAPCPPDARPLRVGLVCGFTPHHLHIFLTAHLRQRDPQRQPLIETGVYGDCLGNLHRITQSEVDAVAIVLEWPDLDPRLGIRQVGGWVPSVLLDILETVRVQVERFQRALTRVSAQVPLTLCLPTLPIPPVAYTPGWLSSNFDLQLRVYLSQLAAELALQPGIRVLNAQRLDQLSPPGDRLDVRSEYLSGFPYPPSHASVVGELLASLLLPPAPKKGLITDLDDTLWRGILGEVGAAGVSWNLDQRSQLHALYQQLLQSLAESGVLLAVASKNDAARVEEALQRNDLLIRPEHLFPVEAHWEPKSHSVQRILRAWNISADSVVFVDDSPLELAEVQALHPGIEAIQFPREQDQAAHDLLWRLRDLFGKPRLGEEDRLRMQSLRQANALAEFQQGGSEDNEAERDAFLVRIDAEVVLDTQDEQPLGRPLELVNKTNQFNLNGRRYTEREWQTHLESPQAFLCVVSYRDKFGPLGKIAVLSGRHEEDVLRVDTWVMSCRAFSRRIEYQSLQFLFDQYFVDEIVFDFLPTPKNGPLQEFFTDLLGEPPTEKLSLSRSQFESQCPALFHEVKVTAHG